MDSPSSATSTCTCSDNEVISVHTTSSSDFDDDDGSDVDTLMGTPGSPLLTASSDVLRTQPSAAKGDEAPVGSFKLTKAPAAKPIVKTKRKASQSPRPTTRNSSTKKAKKNKECRPTTTKENDQQPQQSSVLETLLNVDPPRRARRTPLEAAEAEERRVQQELAAARARLDAQKTSAKKKQPPAKKQEKDTEDDSTSTQLNYMERTSSEPKLETNAKKPADRSKQPSTVSERAQGTMDPNKNTKKSAAKPVQEAPGQSASTRPQVKQGKDGARAVESGKTAEAATAANDANVKSKQKAIPTPSTTVPTVPADTNSSVAATKATTCIANTSAKKNPTKKKKMTFDEQVLAHMRLAFKPFSLKTLAHELDSTETIVNFSMLTMVDKGLVVKKDFPTKGGAKDKTLYWANHGVSAKELSAPQVATEVEMHATKAELDTLRQQLAVIHRELNAVLETPSNADLTQQVTTEQGQLDELRAQLNAMKERIRSTSSTLQSVKPPSLCGRNQPAKSAAELARERCPRRMKIRINNMRAEWKNRKEKCTDFINVLADGLEKKPKDVISMLDLETDEMIGVKLPPKYVVEDRR